MSYKPDTDNKVKFSSAAEFVAAIDAFFEEAQANNRPLTMSGLACALDMSREVLIRVHELEYPITICENDRTVMRDALKVARRKCRQYAEEYIYNGKNQVGGIFGLKANWGIVDKQEVEISGPGGGPILMIHRAAQQALEQSPTQQAIELADDYDPLA